ncbi:probable G-protein coupled receptor Mth-like 7 [Drosophila eugracilis]|uniref:probable G-protein coupled receptor Mth-like 7 n=1 Tax=Drosophila eugracilis TaxID=29029 RepID=UPI0007E79E19|nr:probable G-protein coupled receptor Mth-like 7 [Drosophila eugracilis]
MLNGKCNDSLDTQIALGKVYLNVSHGYGSPKHHLVPLKEKLVLREQFRVGDQLLSFKREDYKLFENGTLVLQHNNETLFDGDYCLYPYQFNSDSSKEIWIIRHKNILTRQFTSGVTCVEVISLVCYILTITAYLYIKKLRNTFGYFLISSICNIFVHKLFHVMTMFNLLNGLCCLAAYMYYFFNISYNIWLSVICHYVWKKIRSTNPIDGRPGLVFYNTSIWVTAGIPTGVIFLLNQLWAKNPKTFNWMPLVGITGCWVRIDIWSAWFYFFGPLLILGTFNIIMFLWTTIHIWKVKRGIKKLQQEDEIICLSVDFQTYVQFFRISVIMGLTWSLNVVSYYVRLQGYSDPVMLVTEYINASFGIIIFVLLILRRSILRLLFKQ